MSQTLTDLRRRVAAPITRRTGLAALAAMFAGVAGFSGIDAKKKKKKKRPVVLGGSCSQVADCVDAVHWQCAPYANSQFGSSATATYCLLHDGDSCDQHSACPYGLCQNGQCASASVVDPTNGPFLTLADAVAGTFAGGEICIVPGTYDAVSVTIDKTLTITTCADSGQVILTSPSNGRVFTLLLPNVGDVVTIRGLTDDSLALSGQPVADDDRLDHGGLINLTQTNSGGLAAGSLVLEKVTLFNGKSRISGGGIHAHTSGSVTLTDVTVTVCISPRGGGIAMQTGALTLNGQTWIRRCQASDRGAGVLLVDGTTTLSMAGTARIGNRVAYGDGVACWRDNGNWGTGSGVGGGVYAEPGTAVTMAEDAQIACNLAWDGGGIFAGEGASLSGNATCDSGKVLINRDNDGISNIEGYVTTPC